jgi:hypothetical protein
VTRTINIAKTWVVTSACGHFLVLLSHFSKDNELGNILQVLAKLLNCVDVSQGFACWHVFLRNKNHIVTTKKYNVNCSSSTNELEFKLNACPPIPIKENKFSSFQI